jgi:hypothetical protein
METGAGHCQPHQRLQWLLVALAMLVINASAHAQPCPSDPPGVNPSSPHPTSATLRSAIRSTLNLSGPAQPCHRSTPNQAIDVHHLSLAAASLVIARQTRIEMDPRATDGEGRVQAGQPLSVQWRNTVGPAWVASVPDWVTDTAKNYRHRGLPLVDLWQSSHYLLALGLSNHGVPGVYFSQKLP